VCGVQEPAVWGGTPARPFCSIAASPSRLADTHRVAAFAPLYLQLQVLGVLDVIPRARTGQLLCTLYARCESSTRSLWVELIELASGCTNKDGGRALSSHTLDDLQAAISRRLRADKVETVPFTVQGGWVTPSERCRNALGAVHGLLVRLKTGPPRWRRLASTCDQVRASTQRRLENDSSASLVFASDNLRAHFLFLLLSPLSVSSPFYCLSLLRFSDGGQAR
jgi:hypothetical protein